MKNADRAKLIVDAILEDLTDRRGLKHEWHRIDEDIQEEIKQSWITIVLSGLKARARRKSRPVMTPHLCFIAVVVFFLFGICVGRGTKS